jgi:phage gpG-like protein
VKFIHGTVTGDAEVIQHLRAIPQKTRTELTLTVRRLAIDLQRHVKQDKLSGQVLRNRTGTLRRSITNKVVSAPDGVRAQVGTNVSYARVHEYGYSGTEAVKEHMRKVRMAFGRAIEERAVVVRGHSRRVNIKERSFLRSSLSDKAETIKMELKAAVLRSVV